MRKNNTMKNMTIAAVIGGVGVAGYMYMRKNSELMHNMKVMMKSAAKKTYEKLEETV